MVLTAVVYGLTWLGGREDLQRLVEHLFPAPVVELLPRRRQLPPDTVAADADDQGEAAVAEPVECRGLPGNLWPGGRRGTP